MSYTLPALIWLGLLWYSLNYCLYCDRTLHYLLSPAKESFYWWLLVCSLYLSQWHHWTDCGYFVYNYLTVQSSLHLLCLKEMKFAYKCNIIGRSKMFRKGGGGGVPSRNNCLVHAKILVHTYVACDTHTLSVQSSNICSILTEISCKQVLEPLG